MRLVKASYQIMAMSGFPELPYSYADSDRLIEAAGRTCYKSEDKITETSAKPFVEMLEKRTHFAMIEHSWEVRLYFGAELPKYPSPFLRSFSFYGDSIVVGNRTAFTEVEQREDLPKGNYWLWSESAIRAFSEHYSHHLILAMTVKFITDRGVSHELVRHRPCSFAQESTRYCNYKDGVAFIIPPWLDLPEGEFNNQDLIEFKAQRHLNDIERRWLANRFRDEENYVDMLKFGWKSEQARGELPTCLKTEIWVTAPVSQWRYMFYRRDDKAVHEQMRELMNPLHEEVKEKYPVYFGG
ncbi:MAG: FAD-dependent thymidylate synthase [Candidatus Paceibacterota bacterium]|jgi:thymidylate synthase ThyX